MKIYINIKPGNMGGPSVFVKNFVEEVQRRGHKVVYDLEKDCDAALNLVNASGKLFKFCKEHNIKSVGRLDGFYIPEYWNNQDKHHRMTLDKIQTNNAMRHDLKHYDAVIYQSEWSKQMFNRWISKRTENVHVIHNGVNEKIFRPDRNKKKTNTVLICGVLRHSYMLESFFGAYDVLNKNKKRYNWLIAGTMDEASKKIFSKYASRPNVKYLGPFDNRLLPDIYNKADIFFHPRLGDSSPNSCLESLSCGVPIVCGSWGGTSEFIGRGGKIVLTDKWSYGKKYQNECAEAIKQVLGNYELHSFKARKRIEKYHKMSDITDRYLEVMKP